MNHLDILYQSYSG